LPAGEQISLGGNGKAFGHAVNSSGKGTTLASFPDAVLAAGEPIMDRLLAFLATLFVLAFPRVVQGDAFDHYINTVLSKVPDAKGVKEIKQLTPTLIADHDGVLPRTNGALVVIKTNEGRYCKLLIQDARQNISSTESVPILLIDRYITYKEGEEQAVQARGQNIRLFDGFQFNFDIGQVVPANVGGDLRFVAAKDKTYAEPVGKAKLYLVTKPLPEATPKKATRPEVGASFESRFFNGIYKLYDDGRRSGTLHLKVEKKNNVSGKYYSAKDGRKYEVVGKIGSPAHTIEFTIIYPRTRQEFHGWMFTGDGKAIAGFTRLQDRDMGFYALRVEK
jgi:hypothetical protein